MQYRNSLDKKFGRFQLHLYHSRHERNHRAVSVIWGIMTIMFAILNVMAFAQPHWIGDTNDSPGFGHLGVFQLCTPDYNTGAYFCTGSFSEFSTILTDAFRATTVFCGLSALLMLLCVLILLLFFCFKTGKVFVLCGVLETAAAVFMFLACVIYPSGWNIDEVKQICGTTSGQYQLGYCNIRWAYILAIIGIFDAAILAVLAFFLAAKRAKLEVYGPTGTVTKSELNGFSAESMSKRSIPINPVVTVPADSARSASNFQL